MDVQVAAPLASDMGLQNTLHRMPDSKGANGGPDGLGLVAAIAD